MNDQTKKQLSVAIVAAVTLIACSRRLRRSLRHFLLSWLLLLQLLSGSALVAYRGLDAIALLTGCSLQNNGPPAYLRRLSYVLLLCSTVTVPAKGVAHLLPAAGAVIA